MSYPYIVQGNNITIVIGTTPHTISSTHIFYNKVLDAIKNQDWETVQNIIEPKKVILEYGQGNISIQGSRLFWKDFEFHNSLSRRMIQMLQDGFAIDPLVKFMENLMQNSSKRAVDELYSFLESNDLPITDDGHFLAYKKVRNDYTDVHTSSVLNKPFSLMTEQEQTAIQAASVVCGKDKEVTVYVHEGETVVAMERNRVDDNKERTCSDGLHFCSIEYLKSFEGDRIVIVKVNPRDVVSIPIDYGYSKGRTCKYRVIGELGVNPEQAFTQPVQSTANESVQKKSVDIDSTGFWPAA